MAGRPSGPKTRCSGTWTEAKFRSFIKGNLRRTTQKWKPIQDCLKFARVERGIYLCAGCNENVPATIKESSGRRIKNVHVDHIHPVVDPTIGWTNWDDCINRLFCESDNLQCLCEACHKIKTDAEKQLAKARGELDIDE